jgi:hypothetical protein
MGLPQAPVYFRIHGTHTLVGSSEETTLQFPAWDGADSFQAESWLLVSFHYVRTAGAATNMAPALGQAAGFASGDINERAVYASQVVGTPINDIFSSAIPCRTDAAGRLYFQPRYTGGAATGTAQYEFWFQKVLGS